MYGEEPAANGNNNSGILFIRNCLAVAADNIDDHLNAFLITAPHTHWDPDKPVIVSRSESGYFVGPQPINSHKTYTPVSFVFGLKGPVPYEWADESIQFQERDLEIASKILGHFGMEPGIVDLPFGLSLRFRFKDLFAPPMDATIEYTEDETTSELAQVYELKKFQNKRAHRDYAQVGWHPYTGTAWLQTNTESEILEKIMRLSQNLSDQEKALLAQQIEEIDDRSDEN